MTVRWYSGNFSPGYGVSGELEDDIGLSKLIDMRLIAQGIPKQLVDSPDSDEALPIILHLMYVRWRFTLQLVTAFDDEIQVYSSRMENRKLGRWKTEINQYVSSDGFWSYNNYISPMFVFAQRWINFDYDPEDLPCSEPQVDAPELFDLNRLAFPVSNNGDFTGTPGNSLLGDRVTIYPEQPIALYRWGVTYDYTIEGYTEANLSDIGGDVNFYIL